MGKPWLALMIGNSRLHWAAFQAESLVLRWDTPHWNPLGVKVGLSHVAPHPIQAWAVKNLGVPIGLADWPQSVQDWLIQQLASQDPIALYLASVVPEQTQLWQPYPHVQILELADIPLQKMYPTLGIDRALAVWGAGQHYGFPQLVIDAGTALTFTGADAAGMLVGGAILPGLGIQFQVLTSQTAQLPRVQAWEIEQLPPRWAMETDDAIASGVIHTVLAGIQAFAHDWQGRFPAFPSTGMNESQTNKQANKQTNIVLTGGDAALIWRFLQQENPILADQILVDQELVFWGIKHYKLSQTPAG